MYTILVLWAILLIPVPTLVNSIRRGLNPYTSIMESMVAVGAGCTGIFIIASLSGNSLGAEIETGFQEAADLMMASTGLSEEVIRAAADTAASLIPSTILIMGAVVAYLEYKLISRFLSKTNDKVLFLPPLREFAWPRQGVYGWMLIFLLSWGTRMLGFPNGEMVAINVMSLIEAAFALQGVAVVLMFLQMRRVPGGLSGTLAVLLWFLPMGKTVLYLLGFADIVFGIRMRISQR